MKRCHDPGKLCIARLQSLHNIILWKRFQKRRFLRCAIISRLYLPLSVSEWLGHHVAKSPSYLWKMLSNFVNLLHLQSTFVIFLSFYVNFLSFYVNFQQPLAAFGNPWQLLAIQLLTSFINFWHLSSTFGPLHQLLATFVNFCQRVILSSCPLVLL